jgi:hypothetical protein
LLNNESLLKLEIDNKATIETEKIPEVTVPSNVSDFDLSDL